MRASLFTIGVATYLLGAASMTGCAGDPMSPNNNRSIAESSRVPGPSAAVAELEAAAQGRQTRGIEDEILRMENVVPGLGGMFQDASGNVNVYVPRGANAEVVKAAISKLAPALGVTADLRRQLAGTSLRLIVGDYPFSQLVAWQAALDAQVKRGMGIFGVDADEASNRLRILVTDQAYESAARQLAAKAGIPAGAVVVEVGAAPQLAAGLRGTFRPTGGGVQNASDTETCTLGFNVTTGDLTKGYLTASHCAGGSLGAGLTGTTMYQPILGYPVGWIRWNPAWNLTDPRCGSATLCTDADAMYVQYNDNGLAAKRVAYTDYAGLNSQGGSITVTGWWTNVVPATSPMVGQALDKMGRTTGWTRGTLVASCIDVTDPGSVPRLVEIQVVALV